MGLDSIALLTMIESYFGINISNIDAEKICTIQDMVTTVARYLNIANNDEHLLNQIHSKLYSYLGIELKFDDAIAKHLPYDEQQWQYLAQGLDLMIPTPYIANQSKKISTSFFQKLVQLNSPNYKWEEITVRQFMTAICVNNYQKLLHPKTIESYFEIYIAIMGITVHHAGVDYYEISPEKWFTNDLGID